MEEKTEYAVILTDRLHGPDGQPIRSPFAYINHPAQTADLQPLLSILSDPSRANYYGDIAGTGAQHIAFAWTFTTAPVYEDMRLLRDGLYGKGPFAALSTQFPAKAVALRALGMASDPSDEAGPLSTVPNCQPGLNAPYVVYVASAMEALQLIVQVALTDEFSLTPSQQAAVLRQSGLGGPLRHRRVQLALPRRLRIPPYENPEESFDLKLSDRPGARRVLTSFRSSSQVPKAKAGSQQPFPTAVWSHGTSLFMEGVDRPRRLSRAPGDRDDRDQHAGPRPLSHPGPADDRADRARNELQRGVAERARGLLLEPGRHDLRRARA